MDRFAKEENNEDLALKEMLVKDIFKKMKKMAINSKLISNSWVSGNFQTAFKGSGMTFKEVKEYSENDDVRFIDWNVSAKMGSAYTKVFEEEREHSIYILADVSASQNSRKVYPNQQHSIYEIAAILLYAALSNNDFVHLVLFTDIVEKVISSRGGKAASYEMVKKMVKYIPKSNKTDLSAALKYVQTTSNHISIIFIISDFMYGNYGKHLKILGKKHDIVGIQVVFQDELPSLPQQGYLIVEDIETGERNWVNSSDRIFRKEWEEELRQNLSTAKTIFKECPASFLQIPPNSDYSKMLMQFFNKKR